MAVTIYGIRTCDTMRKARAWLDAHDVPAVFHDYRKDGVSAELLASWIAETGWEKLLNRAGTTFRKLPDEERQDLTQGRAVALMVAHPAMIRRPVLVGEGGRIVLGFSADSYTAFFGIVP